MRAEQQMAPVAAQQNLVALLLARASRPDVVGATVYEGGGWKSVTWGAIRDEVRRLSAALVGYGVKPGDRVAVFAATSLRWCIVDLAVSAARGITIPIYASNTPEEVQYILEHSGSSLLFVDDDVADGKQPGRLSRVRACRASAPGVKQVVVFEGPTGSGEVPYRDFIAKGDAVEKADPKGFETRIQSIKMSDPCLFIYTSGTTGNPKGVQLTHGNWALRGGGHGANWPHGAGRLGDAVSPVGPQLRPGGEDGVAELGLPDDFLTGHGQADGGLGGDLALHPSFGPAHFREGVRGRHWEWLLRPWSQGPPLPLGDAALRRVRGRQAAGPGVQLARLRARPAARLLQGEGDAGPEARRKDAALRLRRRAALTKNCLLL